MSTSKLITPRLVASLVGALILAAGGCLERFEHITVKPDTSVSLESTFKGDASDIAEGDALPAPGGRWDVTDSLQQDASGDKGKLVRTATLEIPAGADIPGTYAENAGDEAVSLRFPTSVTTEPRAEGLCYHFKRTYRARPDASYNVTRHRLEADKDTRKLLDADPATLSPQDLSRLIDSFRAMEVDKQLAYLHAALGAIPDRPQDVGLRIRASLIATSEKLDREHVAKLLQQPASDERDREIASIANAFLADMKGATELALDAEKLTVGERKAFLAALDKERRSRAVTEDLNDERWEVRVRLPGTVIAHNADAIEGAELVWRFNSISFLDRDLDLEATSILSSANK